jgi:uncharacterized membrane protein YheB (UPF0754 family)
MRIVVEISIRDGKDFYEIKVLDGEELVYVDTATTLDKRDEITWKLADMYNVLDIEIGKKRKKKKKEEFRYSIIPSIPVLDKEEAMVYFQENMTQIMDRILEAIGEGLDQDLAEIRLFELNGTGVYLTSQRHEWIGGLEQAIEYFVSTEEYEKCIVAKQLLGEL